MALLTIRVEGDPILRKISKPVTVFDDKLKRLAEDMLETMDHAEGVGLAAVQVGRLKRVIAYMDIEKEEKYILVNPEILTREGEITETEACLSVPGTFGDVTRPQCITLKGQDLNGNEINLRAENHLARVLCHEIDHLDGILYIDTATDITEG